MAVHRFFCVFLLLTSLFAFIENETVLGYRRQLFQNMEEEMFPLSEERSNASVTTQVFGKCSDCKCCNAAKTRCVSTKCCHRILCNNPNVPYGQCSFSAVSCNCDSCN